MPELKQPRWHSALGDTVLAPLPQPKVPIRSCGHWNKQQLSYHLQERQTWVVIRRCWEADDETDEEGSEGGAYDGTALASYEA